MRYNEIRINKIREVFFMAEKKKILTYTGLRALEEELENLKVVKRKEVAVKIREAREQGEKDSH